MAVGIPIPEVGIPIPEGEKIQTGKLIEENLCGG